MPPIRTHTAAEMSFTPVVVPLLPNFASRGDGSDGHLTREAFGEIVEGYLAKLNGKKRDKALITGQMCADILRVFHEPKNTKAHNAQFRFWARKMFRVHNFAGHDIVCHENRPVATREQLYDVLIQCHDLIGHAGRDKTSAQTRLFYSWVPKEIVAQFVKACPTCEAKRLRGFYSSSECIGSSDVEDEIKVKPRKKTKKRRVPDTSSSRLDTTDESSPPAEEPSSGSAHTSPPYSAMPLPLPTAKSQLATSISMGDRSLTQSSLGPRTPLDGDANYDFVASLWAPSGMGPAGDWRGAATQVKYEDDMMTKCAGGHDIGAQDAHFLAHAIDSLPFDPATGMTTLPGHFGLDMHSGQAYTGDCQPAYAGHPTTYYEGHDPAGAAHFYPIHAAPPPIDHFADGPVYDGRFLFDGDSSFEHGDTTYSTDATGPADYSDIPSVVLALQDGDAEGSRETFDDVVLFAAAADRIQARNTNQILRSMDHFTVPSTGGAVVPVADSDIISSPEA